MQGTQQDRREHGTGYELEVFEYFLKPGFILANREDSVVRAVLGNCVSVTIYDRENRFGGMNHFIFPGTKDRRLATPQFGNVAVTALCRMMLDLGASTHSLEAQIMGGATHMDVEDRRLGLKNVEVARKVLDRFRIPVVSEDVGGNRGRKIMYHTGTNETVIYKVDKIRENDWFLPGEDIRFR